MLARLVGKTFMLSTNLSGPQLIAGILLARLAEVIAEKQSVRGFGAALALALAFGAALAMGMGLSGSLPS